jgi:hypothetical protein
VIGSTANPLIANDQRTLVGAMGCAAILQNAKPSGGNLLGDTLAAYRLESGHHVAAQRRFAVRHEPKSLRFEGYPEFCLSV